MSAKVHPADVLSAVEALLGAAKVTLPPELQDAMTSLAAEVGPGDPERLKASLQEFLPELQAFQAEARAARLDGELPPVKALDVEAIQRLTGQLAAAWGQQDGEGVDAALASLRALTEDPAAERERLEADAAASISASVAGVKLKPLLG